MPRILCIALALAIALAMPALAQDLDTTDVSDTFDSGARGNATGTGGLTAWGDTLQDGTEYQELTNTDGVTGTIRYINTWAGATAGEDETPVVTFTAAHDNQDRSLTAGLAAIASNSNDSVSPTTGIIVGDDGGFNALFWGESDDANYYVQADVFCYDRTTPGTGYEVHEVTLRAARDNDPADIETGGYSSDRSGGYSLAWDAQLGIVSARRWEANWSGGTALTSTDIANRDAGTFTEFAQQSLTEGWHTFRIEAYGSQIKFSVDGSELIEVTDATYANGRPGLVYRESGVDSAQETQGHFDNMTSGPSEAPPAPFEPPFQYIGALPANGRPLALAGDSSGGLYYATFNAQGAASGEAGYYIADPAAEIGDLDASDHVQFGSAEGAGFPAGRGWQGIGVGTSGEVFLSGDSGSAGILARYGAAPAFTPDATFNSNAATNATGRFGGLALMGDTTIAVAEFGGIAYFAAADASVTGYTNSTGGVSYQREALYNAEDDVLYATRNGNSDDALIAGHYSGGSVGAGNYAWTASELIPDGAINTAFGTSTGHGYIDNGVSPPRLYTVDTQSASAGQSDPVLRIWDIDAGGTSLTLVGTVDVLTLASAGDIADCVRVGDTLYVSSTGDQAIYAFQPIVNTPVGDFELYR